MSIFQRKQTNSGSALGALSAQLKQQSVNALDTFHRVMQDLKDINAQSEVKQAELAEEAARINQEIKDLAAVNVTNVKVITNIEKILS